MKVLSRDKFDKYLPKEEREKQLKLIFEQAEFFPTGKLTILACRDVEDNKFLELALAAKADCIITGDKDLLVLHPFHDIPILSPSDFVNQWILNFVNVRNFDKNFPQPQRLFSTAFRVFSRKAVENRRAPLRTHNSKLNTTSPPHLLRAVVFWTPFWPF